MDPTRHFPPAPKDMYQPQHNGHASQRRVSTPVGAPCLPERNPDTQLGCRGGNRGSFSSRGSTTSDLASPPPSPGLMHRQALSPHHHDNRPFSYGADIASAINSHRNQRHLNDNNIYGTNNIKPTVVHAPQSPHAPHAFGTPHGHHHQQDHASSHAHEQPTMMGCDKVTEGSRPGQHIMHDNIYGTNNIKPTTISAPQMHPASHNPLDRASNVHQTSAMMSNIKVSEGSRSGQQTPTSQQTAPQLQRSRSSSQHRPYFPPGGHGLVDMRVKANHASSPPPHNGSGHSQRRNNGGHSEHARQAVSDSGPSPHLAQHSPVPRHEGSSPGLLTSEGDYQRYAHNYEQHYDQEHQTHPIHVHTSLASPQNGGGHAARQRVNGRSGSVSDASLSPLTREHGNSVHQNHRGRSRAASTPNAILIVEEELNEFAHGSALVGASRHSEGIYGKFIQVSGTAQTTPARPKLTYVPPPVVPPSPSIENDCQINGVQRQLSSPLSPKSPGIQRHNSNPTHEEYMSRQQIIASQQINHQLQNAQHRRQSSSPQHQSAHHQENHFHPHNDTYITHEQATKLQMHMQHPHTNHNSHRQHQQTHQPLQLHQQYYQSHNVVSSNTNQDAQINHTTNTKSQNRNNHHERSNPTPNVYNGSNHSEKQRTPHPTPPQSPNTTRPQQQRFHPLPHSPLSPSTHSAFSPPSSPRSNHAHRCQSPSRPDTIPPPPTFPLPAPPTSQTPTHPLHSHQHRHNTTIPQHQHQISNPQQQHRSSPHSHVHTSHPHTQSPPSHLPNSAPSSRTQNNSDIYNHLNHQHQHQQQQQHHNVHTHQTNTNNAHHSSHQHPHHNEHYNSHQQHQNSTSHHAPMSSSSSASCATSRCHGNQIRHDNSNSQQTPPASVDELVRIRLRSVAEPHDNKDQANQAVRPPVVASPACLRPVGRMPPKHNSVDQQEAANFPVKLKPTPGKFGNIYEAQAGVPEQRETILPPLPLHDDIDELPPPPPPPELLEGHDPSGYVHHLHHHNTEQHQMFQHPQQQLLTTAQPSPTAQGNYTHNNSNNNTSASHLYNNEENKPVSFLQQQQYSNNNSIVNKHAPSSTNATDLPPPPPPVDFHNSTSSNTNNSPPQFSSSSAFSSSSNVSSLPSYFDTQVKINTSTGETTSTTVSPPSSVDPSQVYNNQPKRCASRPTTSTLPPPPPPVSTYPSAAAHLACVTHPNNNPPPPPPPPTHTAGNVHQEFQRSSVDRVDPGITPSTSSSSASTAVTSASENHRVIPLGVTGSSVIGVTQNCSSSSNSSVCAAQGVGALTGDMDLEIPDDIDLSQCPGLVEINDRTPNWKRDMIEKKNQERIEEYVKNIIKQREQEAKWKNIPEWKRKILQQKEQEGDASSPTSTSKKPTKKAPVPLPGEDEFVPPKPKGDIVPAALSIDPEELAAMPPWKRELLFKRDKVPVTFSNEFNPDEEEEGEGEGEAAAS